MSWADLRFFTLDPGALETLWYRLSGGTLSVTSRISRKPSPLNDASVDVSGGTLVDLAATVLSLDARSRLQERMVLDVAKLTRAAVQVAGKERAGGRLGSRPWEREEGQRWERGPAAGKMTSLLARDVGLLWRRCGGSHGFWWSGCGAAMCVCQTFSAPSWSSMTARLLVAGSLLVIRQPSGS